MRFSQVLRLWPFHRPYMDIAFYATVGLIILFLLSPLLRVLYRLAFPDLQVFKRIKKYPLGSWKEPDGSDHYSGQYVMETPSGATVCLRWTNVETIYERGTDSDGDYSRTYSTGSTSIGISVDGHRLRVGDFAVSRLKDRIYKYEQKLKKPAWEAAAREHRLRQEREKEEEQKKARQHEEDRKRSLDKV